MVIKELINFNAIQFVTLHEKFVLYYKFGSCVSWWTMKETAISKKSNGSARIK